MHKYDYIELTEGSITGVISPKLRVTGYIFKDKFNFLLLVDNKEAKYDLNYDEKKHYFQLESNLITKKGKVELYLLASNKKDIIYENKTSTFKRLLNKIAFFLTKLFKKILKLISVIKRGIVFAWRRHHFLIPPKYWVRYFKKFTQKVVENRSEEFYNPYDNKDYHLWFINTNIVEKYKKQEYEPLISIVIPVYNIERVYLTDCLNSILNQNYKNFEVCLADDNSTNQETLDTLKEFEKKDKRIKVVYRKENGHISKATNSAIEIAKGEYIALMDDDDVITEDALYQFVKVLNKHPEMDLLYSDEDKMELDGTFCEPNFKPDYSPDTILGGNYICHFSMYRKKIVDEIGGFRPEFVGAQDYDLVLRFTDKTNNVYHIPKILYHWRKVPGSTAVTIDNKEYAIENGRRAVAETLARRNLKGMVIVPIKSAHYIVEYETPGNPLISIIIPTKDGVKNLKRCLKSIYEKSTYKNYEIIVVNNNSEKPAMYKLFDKYKEKYKNFRVIDANYKFNYSKINNDAVKEANGDYVLLLNDDTKVITENWLELMLGYAMQKHVGAVGVKLLYSDYTVQHGGIVLGLGGIGANVYGGIDRENYGAFGRLLIPFDYSAVTAACLMVKKSKYLEVNGLDEDLTVAYNDVDFNIKLLEKGYNNVFLPNVELFHFESQTRGKDTTKEKKARLEKESEYMMNKWHDIIKNDKYYNSNLSLRLGFWLDRRK